MEGNVRDVMFPIEKKWLFWVKDLYKSMHTQIVVLWIAWQLQDPTYLDMINLGRPCF